MSALESHLASLFDGEFAALHDAGLTVVGSRGKRLRPALLLLSCACFGEVDTRAIANACLVELVHTASLVHDDVVDEADFRRGAPAAHVRWGNKFSILLGDFLLARVFELATADGDPAVLRMLAPTASAMGRGVILELSHLDIDADEATYWRVIHGKTAALFATTTGLGALIGGADAAQQQCMRQLGEAFGYAFQLADDLLDLSGAAQDTGKPQGTDWRQSRATLPLLYAMRHAPESVAAQIRALWAHSPLREDDLQDLKCLVDRYQGFEYGWGKVKEYLADASRCVAQLPDSRGREALRLLCTDEFPLPVLPSVR
jgi:octaprenyl-diphosphate synthase